MKEKDAYSINVECTNCGYGADAYIPKGMPVDEHFAKEGITCVYGSNAPSELTENSKCPRCGVRPDNWRLCGPYGSYNVSSFPVKKS